MKRQIAAILTATAIPLAACTATSGADPTASSDPASSSVTASSPVTTTSTEPVDSRPSGTDTVSAPPMDTSPASVSMTSASTTASGDAYDDIPVEIPATITGAALDATNAAIPVWRNAVRLYDESMQNPGDEWAAKFREYVVDPAAITQLSLVAEFVENGMHQVGDTGYEAKVVLAKPHNVQIQACVDATRVDVVNADGTSITEGSARRFLWDFNLDFYPDEVNHWLLNLVTKPNPTKPC